MTITAVRPSAAKTAAGAAEDGRHAIRERNRMAVVDAMLTLYASGNLDPSSDQIAERAGLSPRSLFRYFDDIDDLVRVAVARHHHRVVPLAELDTASAAPIAERVRRLVEQRLRLFDAIASVGTVARVRAPFQPLIAAELATARAFWREQLRQLFAPELRAMGKSTAAHVVASIDVLASYESVQLMRDDQGLSATQIAAALVHSITALVNVPVTP
ncbi:MAG: TetR/AcrR family transcriptional regulator [Actinomycetia bacterium]|nr:TetR/AcrR family transcriptional regulator [Actinomycetes bacterium]